MTKVIDFTGDNDAEVLAELTLISMRHNYMEFVADRGYDDANKAMENLFPALWPKCREEIWQWYDQEFFTEKPADLKNHYCHKDERYVWEDPITGEGIMTVCEECMEAKTAEYRIKRIKQLTNP